VRSHDVIGYKKLMIVIIKYTRIILVRREVLGYRMEGMIVRLFPSNIIIAIVMNNQ